MHHAFNPLADGLAAHGFDHHEHQTAAVQAGDGQKVHQTEVDGDDYHQVQEDFQAALLGLLGYQLHHADGAGSLVQAFPCGKQLANRV